MLSARHARQIAGIALAASGIWGSACVAATDAETAFAEFEERLLTSDFSLEFNIVASGPYPAQLAGTTTLSGADDASVKANGVFAGQSASIRLTAHDGRMKGGNGALEFDQATPEALREAMVIGLTRMGLLHNLAMMSSGAPPDHADGGVRDWVQAANLKLETDALIEGRPAVAFSFAVVVSGEDSGSATLWVDAETGLPLKREQVVSFGNGEMRVTETYPALTIIAR